GEQRFGRRGGRGRPTRLRRDGRLQRDRLVRGDDGVGDPDFRGDGRDGLGDKLVDGRRARNGGFTGERVLVFALGPDDLERRGLIAGRQGGGGRGRGLGGAFAAQEAGAASGAEGAEGWRAGGLRWRRDAGGRVRGGRGRRAGLIVI